MARLEQPFSVDSESYMIIKDMRGWYNNKISPDDMIKFHDMISPHVVDIVVRQVEEAKVGGGTQLAQVGDQVVR